MKNFKTTLITLAVLVLVGGYIFFFERGPAKSDKTDEKKEKVFGNFVADDIKQITLEDFSNTLTAEKNTIELEKDEKGDWQIESPKKFRADEGTVRSMLNGVGEFNPDTTISNPPSLKDYGLDPPLAKATFLSKSGASYVLLIGAKDIAGSNVYVKPTSKNDVYLVGSWSADSLHKGLNDYRDHNFFKTDTVVAQKIKVTHGGKTAVFEKDKNNNWNITQPVQARADTSKIRDLLNSISSLRLTDFVDDHPTRLSKYGLSIPTAEVEVWPSGQGAPQGVLLGAKKEKGGGIYAQNLGDPAVVLIGEYFDKTLDFKLTDYRDKTILQFDSGAVKSLTIHHGANSFTYQKDAKGQWTCPGRPNAATEASNILNQISGITISDFPAPKAGTGLDLPSFTVEVGMADGTKHSFKFGQREKGNVYLSKDKGPEIYLVSDAVVSQMDGYFSTILTPIPITNPAAPPKK